jgi:hypothetical protein
MGGMVCICGEDSWNRDFVGCEQGFLANDGEKLERYRTKTSLCSEQKLNPAWSRIYGECVDIQMEGTCEQPGVFSSER